MVDASKACSNARRLFVFCRWIKYIPQFKDADGEADQSMRLMLRAEAACALGVDALQDVITLEKASLLPKKTIPAWFERVASIAEVALALAGLAASYVRVKRTAHDAQAAEAKSHELAPIVVEGKRRNHVLQQLALAKYACDLCKGWHDSALPALRVSSLRAYHCAILSSFISLHKVAEGLAKKKA